MRVGGDVDADDVYVCGDVCAAECDECAGVARELQWESGVCGVAEWSVHDCVQCELSAECGGIDVHWFGRVECDVYVCRYVCAADSDECASDARELQWEPGVCGVAEWDMHDDV